MIESLLRTVEDTYVPQRLQTTASGCNLVYPGSPGSQSPSVRAGSAVVRRACIAWSMRLAVNPCGGRGPTEELAQHERRSVAVGWADWALKRSQSRERVRAHPSRGWSALRRCRCSTEAGVSLWRLGTLAARRGRELGAGGDARLSKEWRCLRPCRASAGARIPSEAVGQNSASTLATVGTSNDPHVFRVRATTACGRARRLAVAFAIFTPPRVFRQPRRAAAVVAAPSLRGCGELRRSTWGDCRCSIPSTAAGWALGRRGKVSRRTRCTRSSGEDPMLNSASRAER